MKQYEYGNQRARVFTEEGQVMFLKIRDKTRDLLDISGAARSGKMISGVTGDAWDMLACVDRLVELGEIRELTGPDVAGQDRVFVRREK